MDSLQARGIEPNLPEFDDDDTTWEGLENLEETADESSQGAGAG